MKRTLQRILGVAFSGFSLVALNAQDPELSQYYAAPVYTNPALTGSAVCDRGAAGRLALNYRNQWPSLPGTFRSFSASWDQHITSIGGGLGAMVFTDIAGSGLLRTTTISGSYSYLLPMNRNRLFMRFGFQGAYTFRSLDFSKLKFGDQILPTQGFVRPTGEQQPAQQINYPNVNAGWMMYTAKYYLGFAAHNIIQPNWSFYKNPNEVLPIRYTVHAGAVLPIGPAYRQKQPNTISPNILFMTQRNFSQLNIGFYTSRGPLVFGTWFRQTFGHYKTPDAFILLAGFRKNRFKFGYSFDVTVGDGRSAIPYSHEVSATIDWCVPPGKQPFRPLKCPEF